MLGPRNPLPPPELVPGSGADCVCYRQATGSTSGGLRRRLVGGWVSNSRPPWGWEGVGHCWDCRVSQESVVGGPQRRLGRRLEEVAKAVGGGYCRLQVPLKLALAVRETVAGHRLCALEGGRGVTSPLSNASLPPPPPLVVKAGGLAVACPQCPPPPPPRRRSGRAGPAHA